MITAYAPKATAIASRVPIYGNTFPGSFQRESHIKRLSYSRVALDLTEGKRQVFFVCVPATQEETRERNFDSSTNQVKDSCSCGG